MTTLVIEKSTTNGAYTVKDGSKHIGLLIKDPQWQYHNAPNGVWLGGDQMIQIGKKINQLICEDYLDDNNIYATKSGGFHMHSCKECHCSTRDTNKLNTIPHTSVCSRYLMPQRDVLAGKTPD